MSKLILATGADEKYLPKIKAYLKSIEDNSNFDLNLFIYLSDVDYKYDSSKITTLKMLPSKFINRTEINCLQHGEFIKSEGFDDIVNDDDIIFYTDGDIILQRNLNEKELKKYKNITHDDVIIGYNESKEDSLKNEYNRILPVKNNPFNDLNEYKKIKCYNTGVIGMTKKTWKKLMDLYSPLFPDVNASFKYYSKQQWLICLILGTKGFNIIEMDFDEHNHLHFKIQNGTTIDQKRFVYYNNELVLFKHAWEKNMR